MIIDKIENAEKYYCIHPEFKAVFQALAGLSNDSEEKKYEIDGEKAFINLSLYINKPAVECKFEVHKKYADIQFVISGHEYIDLCPCEDAKLTDYNFTDGDIGFLSEPESFTRADLTPGTFAVIFPDEAHKPLVAPDGKGIATKKAVAKILF